MPKPATKNLGIEKWGTYGILVAVCLFLTTVMIQASSQDAQQPLTADEKQYTINQVSSKPTVELKIPDSVAFLGNKDARVTILELSDFQCPFCQRGAFLINSLLNAYPTQIKVGYLNFPLDSSCHRQITRAMHPFACQLARGSVCAEKKGKFKEYYESVFENQPSIAADTAAKNLEQVGFTTDEAKSCLESDDAKKIVSAQIEFGIEQKIESTPTFFLNGKKIEGALPLDVWKSLIDQELAKN